MEFLRDVWGQEVGVKLPSKVTSNRLCLRAYREGAAFRANDRAFLRAIAKATHGSFRENFAFAGVSSDWV